MGCKNDYLTLEESARVLGRPVSFLKGALSEGKLGAKLAGGRWLISARDLEGLRRNLSPKPVRTVRDSEGGDAPGKSGLASRPPTGSRTGAGPVSTGDAASRAKYLQVLDVRVRDLADLIEVELAYLVERKAVWDKVRADNFALNTALRAQLPNSLVSLLDDLRKTKQEYILLRQSERYKGLLRALPEYDYERVAKALGGQPQKRGMAPTEPKPPGGIGGFFEGHVTAKHYRDRYDAPPPMSAGQEARLAMLRSKERAAARSMRDRGKSREAREAAQVEWAQARRSAEAVERPAGEKTTHGRPRVSRRIKGGERPAPYGEHAPGVVVVVEQPVGPRVLDALRRCLRAVGHPDAYATNDSAGVLKDELLAARPRALVAIGAGAARYVDAAGHPPARCPFSEAEPGVWFSWTRDVSGLLLPPIAPALDDEAAKRRFWRAFLTLKTLSPVPA